MTETSPSVRLVTAEVLAADHEGWLPLIVASLNMQVLIVTCNLSDYAAPGASRITVLPENAPL